MIAYPCWVVEVPEKRQRRAPRRASCTAPRSHEGAPCHGVLTLEVQVESLDGEERRPGAEVRRPRPGLVDGGDGSVSIAERCIGQPVNRGLPAPRSHVQQHCCPERLRREIRLIGP